MRLKIENSKFCKYLKHMNPINSNQKLFFWQEQLATSQGMMLNDRASEIDENAQLL
jgi:hypothetical protein